MDPNGAWADVAALVISSIVTLLTLSIAVRTISRRRSERVTAEFSTSWNVEASPQAALDGKVTRVGELSRELSRLNSDIADELRVQIDETRRLQSEADQAQQVSSVSAEAMRATQALIRSGLEDALAQNAKSDRRFQVLVAVVSFLAGVAVTVVVTLLTVH